MFLLQNCVFQYNKKVICTVYGWKPQLFVIKRENERTVKVVRLESINIKESSIFFFFCHPALDGSFLVKVFSILIQSSISASSICSCRSCNSDITTWNFMWPQWSHHHWDKEASPAPLERPCVALVLGQSSLKLSVSWSSMLWVAGHSPWAAGSVPEARTAACCLGSTLGQQLQIPQKNICLGLLSSNLILALGLLRPISASVVV